MNAILHFQQSPFTRFQSLVNENFLEIWLIDYGFCTEYQS